MLAGGVANAGRVVRVGEHVLRPSGPFTPSVHAALSALAAAGFDGASVPVGVDADGRERLVFIEGDVALPPYPAWARSDDALASIARLMSRLHAASGAAAAAGFDPASLRWSDEMADPLGGTAAGSAAGAGSGSGSGSGSGAVLCHNDVCLENVVFHDGEAVALVDFDFCAPGRPVYDVAQFARMCVPVDDDVNATRLGWGGEDRPARLRVVADAYGLDPDGRGELLVELDRSMELAGAFVRRRVDAGDPNFVAMWTAMGGQERFDRRRRWWDEHRPEFAAALGHWS